MKKSFLRLAVSSVIITLVLGRNRKFAKFNDSMLGINVSFMTSIYDMFLPLNLSIIRIYQYFCFYLPSSVFLYGFPFLF